MRSRGVLLGALAVVVALVTRVVLSELLSYLFLPVQRWYFHRYVESFDPHLFFLLLAWVPGRVFPLLGSLAAGTLAAVVYRTKSLGLSAVVGIVVLFGYLAWWHKVVSLYWEIRVLGLLNEAVVFLLLGLLNGAVTFLACYLTQRFLAKR